MVSARFCSAFINPTSLVDFDTSDMDGIMGMAFDVAHIYNTIQRAWGTEAADELGRAPITSLFAQNPSLPNNFDVQLGRTSELEDVADGTFIISGHEPGFEAVAEAPQLPRIDSQHWSIVMDSMLINGEQFAFNKSRIVGAPSGKIVAALDTGFSFPPLPPVASRPRRLRRCRRRPPPPPLPAPRRGAWPASAAC